MHIYVLSLAAVQNGYVELWNMLSFLVTHNVSSESHVLTATVTNTHGVLDIPTSDSLAEERWFLTLTPNKRLGKS